MTRKGLMCTANTKTGEHGLNIRRSALAGCLVVIFRARSALVEAPRARNVHRFWRRLWKLDLLCS